jgi:hypothetical protein
LEFIKIDVGIRFIDNADGFQYSTGDDTSASFEGEGGLMTAPCFSKIPLQ